MVVDPLLVEISAWSIGAGWIPACAVLTVGVVITALVAGSCDCVWVGLRDLHTLAMWPVRLQR